MALAHAQQGVGAFQAAFAAGDFAKAKGLLTHLKILMTEFPSQRVGGTAEPTAEEGALIRQVLELAVLLSIKSGDLKAFERNVAQLKPFLGGAQAESRRHVLGLLLIHLLTEARLSEFHSEVELLAPGDRDAAPIAFPLKLETFLMEGSYNKILACRTSQPSEFFAPFMGRLSDTVREQIADCAAASYGSLSIPAAQKMMMFESVAELGAYLAQHRPEWTVQGNTIRFAAEAAAAQHTTPSGKRGDVDPQALIQNALQYAIEIERIV